MEKWSAFDALTQQSFAIYCVATVNQMRENTATLINRVNKVLITILMCTTCHCYMSAKLIQ